MWKFLLNSRYVNKTFLNTTVKKILLASSIIGLSIVFISCSNIKRPAPTVSTSHYQIVNVNVVDVLNKKILNNVNVEVKAGVIVKVTTAITKSSPSLQQHTPITRIEGSDKYLIPGLWDNHSTVLRFSPEVDFPLYIANGVTSLRSNFSCANESEVSIYACMKDKAHWKNLISNEQLVGPNIHGWGTFAINGKNKQHPDLPLFHGGNSTEKVKKIVEHYASYPMDNRPYFIKTYNWIPKASFFELTKIALDNGFEISGHLPRAVTIEEAVDAGMRSIAHARLFVYNCSTIADEFRQANGPKSKRKLPLTKLYPLLINNFDAEACQEKYQYMADNKVFLNPTLMTRRNDYYGVAGMFNKMQGLEYAHYIMFREWQEDISSHGDNLSAAEINIFKDFYQLTASTVAQAHKAGVKLLAGSDSWSEYNVPGFSLHEELQAMSSAGIDNYSILQAATINGAQYFRVDDKFGSIDTGKRAEMVLLNTNPITDIKNAQDIAMVFKGNKIYNKEKLNTLKTDVKSIAGSHLFTAKLVLDLMKNPTGF